MTAEDEVLLNNLLDSLDRLHDRACGAFDVELLVVSTIIGIRDASWLDSLQEAQKSLRAAIRAGGEDQDAVLAGALVATSDLRSRLAEWWTDARITLWSHERFAG